MRARDSACAGLLQSKLLRLAPVSQAKLTLSMKAETSETASTTGPTCARSFTVTASSPARYP